MESRSLYVHLFFIFWEVVWIFLFAHGLKSDREKKTNNIGFYSSI